MKHWELEHSGESTASEWNEAATFNLDPIGRWVDYHCFMLGRRGV